MMPVEQIQDEDVLVLRLPGPFGHYIVGRYCLDGDERGFRYLENDRVLKAAIWKAYQRCDGENRVWLFEDPASDAFREAPRPALGEPFR